MTEEFFVAEVSTHPEPGSTPPQTGIAAIDAVLDLVAGLDERPLEEHAPVFESVHRELRGALDEPPAAAPA